MSKAKSPRKGKAKPAAAKVAAKTKPKSTSKAAAAKVRPRPAATRSAMSVAEVAKAFTDALKAGEFDKAEALWSDDVVSYEAMEGPMREVRGREAVHGKGAWWFENHEIHSFKAEGPFVTGDEFAVRLAIDATQKATGDRSAMDEIAVYKVKGGKVVEERFFY